EDAVLAGQVGRGVALVGDEELRSVRAVAVALAGVGHRELSGLVELQTGGDLVVERVAGVSPTGPLGVAALDHEARDHAVKDQTAVDRLLLPLAALRVLERPHTTRQAHEVRDGLRRILLEELAV